MSQQKVLFRRNTTQVRWKRLREPSVINSQLNVNISQFPSLAAHEGLDCTFSTASVWTWILGKAEIMYVWISITLSIEYVRIQQAAKEMKIWNKITFKGSWSLPEYTAWVCHPVQLQQCRSLLSPSARYHFSCSSYMHVNLPNSQCHVLAQIYLCKKFKLQ